jgi:uncharacterized Zn finger protein
MACPKCSRKRYEEKVIKKGKHNFLIRQCLECKTEYSLIRVRKSTLTNEWVEIEKEDK